MYFYLKIGNIKYEIRPILRPGWKPVSNMRVRKTCLKITETFGGTV